jgi:cold shock protein
MNDFPAPLLYRRAALYGAEIHAGGRVQADLVKLSQHAEKLEALHRSNAPDAVLDAEFDRACLAAFKLTLDDLSAKDFRRILVQQSPLFPKSAALALAEEQGFDLTKNGGVPLTDWRCFAILLLARREGQPAIDDADIWERRLEIAAAEHQATRGSQSRKRGIVKTFNREKGFGFIAPLEGGRDIWFSEREVKFAALGDVIEEQELSYEEADAKGDRKRATNLERIKPQPPSRRIIVKRWYGMGQCPA